MNIIRTIMNSLPEKHKEVFQTLLSLIELLRKEKGCLGYSILCDIRDKNVFNLISEWKTRQDMDNYMISHRFSILLGTKSLLCEPLEIKIFTVSASEAVNFIRKKN